MINAAVNHKFGSSALFATQNRGFVSQEGGGMPPPSSDTKPEIRVMQILYVLFQGFVSHGGGGLPPPSCDTKPPFCVGQLGRGAHSRHVCCVTQHACLLCHTADSLLSHTADMSAVSHSRHVCCVTQLTCLLCHTADMSAVSHRGHVCCFTQLNSD